MWCLWAVWPGERAGRNGSFRVSLRVSVRVSFRLCRLAGAGPGFPLKFPNCLHSTHSLQSWQPHSMFVIFHLSAHRFISLTMLMISRPLSVRVYSLFTGKDELSTLFSMSPSFSSSFQPGREHLLSDAVQAVFSSEKAPGVPCSLIELQEYEQAPFSGNIPHCQVYGASFLHGILGETFQAIYFGIISILQYKVNNDE